MEKKRIDNYNNILELNHSIVKMYKRLSELEIEGNKHNDEYNTLVDLIGFAARKCDIQFREYNLSDDYMDEFIKLLCDLHHLNANDVYNYININEKPNIVRFVEHAFELALVNHDTEYEDNEKYKGKMVIEGEEYDFDEGLEILKDSGVAQSIIDDISKDAPLMTQDEEFDETLDDYYYIKLQLETHIFMLYLLDAINNERNPEIKARLIQEKYRIISQMRVLEHSFVSQSNIFEDIDYYQSELNEIFKKTGGLYTTFLNYQSDIIIHEQDRLLDRNKRSYTSLNDKVQDILLSIKIKTHLSCISNPAVREALIGDQQAAKELAPSKLDKKVLKKSMKLNKKYVITDKYN